MFFGNLWKLSLTSRGLLKYLFSVFPDHVSPLLTTIPWVAMTLPITHTELKALQRQGVPAEITQYMFDELMKGEISRLYLSF